MHCRVSREIAQGTDRAVHGWVDPASEAGEGADRRAMGGFATALVTVAADSHHAVGLCIAEVPQRAFETAGRLAQRVGRGERSVRGRGRA